MGLRVRSSPIDCGRCWCLALGRVGEFEVQVGLKPFGEIVKGAEDGELRARLGQYFRENTENGCCSPNMAWHGLVFGSATSLIRVL